MHFIPMNPESEYVETSLHYRNEYPHFRVRLVTFDEQILPSVMKDKPYQVETEAYSHRSDAWITLHRRQYGDVFEAFAHMSNFWGSLKSETTQNVYLHDANGRHREVNLEPSPRKDQSND
jgi:hypothetical protein